MYVLRRPLYLGDVASMASWRGGTLPASTPSPRPSITSTPWRGGSSSRGVGDPPRAGRREPESIATRTPSTQREKTQVDRTLQLIRSTGCKSGLVFNPATPLDILKYVMDKVDIILLMSVNPGFGGQAFIPATLDKAREARKMIDESGYDIRLEIDGGVSGANIKEVAEAGVDMFVAGSAIFRDPRTEEAYKKTIDAMRDELAAAKVPANKVAA